MRYAIVPVGAIIALILAAYAPGLPDDRETRAILVAHDTVAACSTPEGQALVPPARCAEARRVATYGTASISADIATLELCQARAIAPGTPSAAFAANCETAQKRLAGRREAVEAAIKSRTLATPVEAPAEKPLGWRLVAVSVGTAAFTMAFSLWLSSFFKRRRKKVETTQRAGGA